MVKSDMAAEFRVMLSSDYLTTLTKEELKRLSLT
jgi:hypothetical protein